MATCANCDQEAFFAYQVTAEFKIPYCSRHIPRFLGNPRESGNLVKIESETPKASKKKAETPVEVEPVVEEAPVVEPEVTEGELEVDEGE